MDFREPRRRRRWRGRLKFDFHPVSGDAVVEEDVEVHLAVLACAAASRVLLLLFPCGRAQRSSRPAHSYWRRPCVAGPTASGAWRVILTRRNDARARRFALGGKALDFTHCEPRARWIRCMRQ